MSLAGMRTGHDATATDEVLVAATRQGDDRAFEQLYGRYQRRIAAYVQGMVGDHGRAEDVTQEVFISALRRMRATERPIAFKPWVYEIAKNACIDAFRRGRRAEEVSFDLAGDSGAVDAALLAPPTVMPDAAVDAKQRLDDLCGAFGGLSDTHHQVLVLRELEGLSYRQIGERLGMSRPSVESTLFRARRRLTEEYAELVSGARCLAVQALLADGADAIGVRDHRRLARHIAHCQPCRREAHAAGVDTAGLAAALRRVAALLPLPAMLRLRRGGPFDQFTGQLSGMAEPATGWGKAAAAAAAVIVAGGAGVAGHSPARSHAAVAPVAVHAVAQHASIVSAGSNRAGRATGSLRSVARPRGPAVASAGGVVARGRGVGGAGHAVSVVRVPAAGGAQPVARERTSGAAVTPAPAFTGTVPPVAVDPSTVGPVTGGGVATALSLPAPPPLDPPAPTVPPTDRVTVPAVDGAVGTSVGSALDTVQVTASVAPAPVSAAVDAARALIPPVG